MPSKAMKMAQLRAANKRLSANEVKPIEPPKKRIKRTWKDFRVK